jgi:hypothetical protein
MKTKDAHRFNIVDWSIGRLTALSALLPDKRTGKNVRYQMADIVKAAFAVFFTQSPSFLAHQKALQKSKGRSNAETVFQMEKIPCDEHIRQMLDPVSPEYFYGEFHAIFQQAQAQGQLQAYRVLGDHHILLSMDGTEYFTSYEISCQNCLQRQRNNGQTQCYHTAILPVVVAPNNPHVLSLPPEFIMPQDGQKKQDCERAAGKRWVTQHAAHYTPLGGILLGDDLYANQPFCQPAIPIMTMPGRGGTGGSGVRHSPEPCLPPVSPLAVSNDTGQGRDGAEISRMASANMMPRRPAPTIIGIAVWNQGQLTTTFV